MNRPAKEELVISFLRKKVGMPANLRGYHYIKEALLMTLEKDKERVSLSFSKEIYPKVAEIYNTPAKSVERATRYAVQSTWERRNKECTDSVFSNASQAPTVSEFITAIAEEIRMYKE